MLKKFKIKYSHLIITIFITLNIIFLAVIASFPFFNGNSSGLHAAPVCNFNGSTSYFASVAIIVKSSSASVPLPSNLGLSLQTSPCSNGWDNGIPWNSGYNNNLQDVFEQSSSFSQGQYISPQQIDAYHSQTGQAPTTFQTFGSINVGGGSAGSTGRIFTCPSGTSCSSLAGNITRTQSSSSQVTLEYYQLIDCAFSPITYTLGGLPQGWTASPSTNTINVLNGTSVPTYTIVVTPAAPTISVTLNCQGASWSTANTDSNAVVTGTIVNTQTNQAVLNIDTQTNPDSSFVSSLLNNNINYEAYMEVSDNGSSSTVQSSPFNFYSCSNHTPTLSVNLSCTGVSWTSTNATSPTVSGNIINAQNQVVASINTQNQAQGSDSSFVKTLEYGQSGLSYTANMSLSSNGQVVSANSGSVIYSNCLNFTPTLSVSLGCTGVSWTGTNLNGGSTITGNVTDTTSNQSVYTIPQQSVSSYQSTFNGSENSFVTSLENNQDNYIATVILTNSGSVISEKSSSVSFYNCTTHMKVPVLQTVTLSCVTGSNNLNVNWTYNNTTTDSTDLFYGTVNDVTTNTNNIATFSSPIANNSYNWNAVNSTDAYTVSGYIKGDNGTSNVMTTSSASISNCLTPKVPLMSSISLACENNTTNNLSITWQAQNVTSTDNFYGYINDVTTGTQVYLIPQTPSVLGQYIWQGANGQDSYTVVGWIENSSGQKFNVTTSSQVSSNCIPKVPVTPVVQQSLPQTSGNAPINILIIAGIVIMTLGVSMLVF